MKKNISGYFTALRGLFDAVAATGAGGKEYGFYEAVEKAARVLTESASRGGKILFIGNGASASIASHMAVDFWKNAGIMAMAFNDSSLLTCISNDFGYKHVFEKPLEMFAGPEDVLISISSSGASDNILCATSAAKSKKLKIITLSGFSKDNPLRKLGDINFYVPSNSYGHVETAHLSICHCLADIIMKGKNGQIPHRRP